MLNKEMNKSYILEPAYLVKNDLASLIMKAGTDPINKWFFGDGCFSAESDLEYCPNTWQHENFVVIHDREIIAYFRADWRKPLNIIKNFSMIIFNKKKGFIVARAVFDYFDYLFVCRGCKVVNWFVAEKNYHAHRVYEKFIKKYFGHYVGMQHSGQMAYNGEVSDIFLYEATCEEYFKWKNSFVEG